MAEREHDDVVRRTFERQVSLFSAPDSPFARRSADALSWIEPLTDDMIVLDVACGAAHATDPISPHVRQIVGIDLTPALLRVGARRLHDSGIANVLLQEGNAESLPFVDASFDLVFCRSSLHHFAGPQPAVTEMLRVCRVGGRIVLVDLIAPSPEVRDRFDHLHRLIDPSHVRSFTERELVELVPGGINAIGYGETSTFRAPIDIAFTDQSDRSQVLDMLRAEVSGEGEATGLDPAEDDDNSLVVSFTSCVVQCERRS